MPLRKIFDLHVVTTGFVFFLLGLIVLPYINREMVKKVNTKVWLGIAAPIIGIATMTFATVLVLIAKGYPDDFVLDYFFSFLAICLFSLAGYAWHIISISDEDAEENPTVKKRRQRQHGRGIELH